MNLSDRFELLEAPRQDGTQTLRARERATGRMVEVHLSASPEESSRDPVLERGSYEGRFYVVTLVDAEAAPLDSAGAWRIRPATAMSAPAAPAPPESGSQPGDFTRMFHLRQAPEPMPVPASKPVQAASAPSEPGEFTRAIQRPAPAASASDDAPAAGQAGDFTRMFQKSGSAPAAVPQPAGVPQPVSEASQNIGAGNAPAAGFPAKYIVAAIVLLSAIAVFVWMRVL